MKKINIKKFLIIFMIIIVILPSFCYAVDTGLGDLNGYGSAMGGSEKLIEKIRPIVALLQTIGSITSVVVLIVIGIKYMIGSVEERAEYKKTLMPYVIGCAIVFATTNLLSIIYNIAKDFF